MNLSLNLLPPEKKEELDNLHRIGMTLKVFFIGLFAIFIFLVFAEFCIMAISIQQKALDERVLLFRRNASFVESKNAQDMLVEYSQKSKAVERELKERNNHWEVISFVNQIMPEEIVLKKLSIIDGVLTINGVAMKRASLLKLEEELKNNDNFDKVESPISNIVSDINAEFEIVATIKGLSP